MRVCHRFYTRNGSLALLTLSGYIDWLFTTPLLLVSLGVLAGLSPASTMLAIFADIFMVVTGLFAGVRGSQYEQGERYKWGWYTISCAAFLLIFYVLATQGTAGRSLSYSRHHELC